MVCIEGQTIPDIILIHTLNREVLSWPQSLNGKRELDVLLEETTGILDPMFGQ
jgi:hypothetical protein